MILPASCLPVAPTVRESVNVALAANGGVATASSTVSSGYAPEYVINGDRTGGPWGNGGGWNDGTENAYPDWLQVDFQGLQTIESIVVVSLQNNYGSPVEPTLGMESNTFGLSDFDIEYWNGSSWVVADSPVGNNLTIYKYIFPTPVQTDKIRVTINNTQDGQYSRMVELEAWTPQIGVPAFITSSLMWLDFDDTSTFTFDSSNIERVNSIVGSGYVENLDPVTQPTHVINADGGWASFTNSIFNFNTAISPRTLFFVVNNVSGGSESINIAPLVGEDEASAAEYIFLRTDASDYDISVDGATSHTGTAYGDFGQQVTGQNINLGLTPAGMSGKRIWCVTSTTPFDSLAFLGGLLSGLETHFSNMELGDFVAYSQALTVSEINEVGNYLAAKRNTTWSDF